jgi:hypothetical protein
MRDLGAVGTLITLAASLLADHSFCTSTMLPRFYSFHKLLYMASCKRAISTSGVFYMGHALCLPFSTYFIESVENLYSTFD